MSRRNTRQGKARRRAERDGRQVTERERKRPGSSDQGPRAVGVQAVQAAPRPGGSGPRNSDERDSGLRSDAGGGLTAVDLDGADLDTDADLENADPDDFGDLDADDADLQAALAEGDLVEADDIGDVAEVAEDLAAATSTGRRDRTDPKTPGMPSPASRPRRRTPRPRAPAGRVPAWSRSSPDGGGEDEEIFVFGDDDDDLPAAQVAVAGATADPVKDYLKQIGKVPLLNAEQEVELAKRIEAGLFAEEKLAEGRAQPAPLTRGSTWSGSPRTAAGPRTTCWRRTCGWWCRWPSGTPGGGCCSWT